MKKRNIVFLMTDQQRFDALGAVNPLVKTPTLDSLAGEGILYDQAVCNCPMCVPSRYSMMLGLYPFQTGVHHNMQMIERDDKLPVKTFAERLTNAGYQTACFGKTHWFIGEYDIPPEVSHVQYSKRGFEVSTGQGGNVSLGKTPPEYKDAFKIVTQRGGEDVAGYVGKVNDAPTEYMTDYRKTTKAIEWLEEGRDESRPFFLYLSLSKPHAPFTVPPEFFVLREKMTRELLTHLMVCLAKFPRGFSTTKV